MKVLKKGRPQKGWASEFECTGEGNDGGGCGAKLLVEQGDLFKTYSHARDETTEYVTFICSGCVVLTDIEGGILPSATAKDLPSKQKWLARYVGAY